MSDLNQNRADLIAREIRKKLKPATIVDPDLTDLIDAIAELWDYAPSFARKLEKSLIAYVNKVV